VARGETLLQAGANGEHCETMNVQWILSWINDDYMGAISGCPERANCSPIPMALTGRIRVLDFL